MIKTVLKNQKKTFFRLMLLVFSLLTVLIFIITSILQYKLYESKKRELLNVEQLLVSAENSIIGNKINIITGDLLYIADSFRLNYKGNGDYTEVQKEWTAFSNRKKIYDQIRFIDTNGDEMVRVNYAENGAYSVDKANLKNKKDRYYFEDTITLKKNQIYFSKLDLNVENDKIEEPIKPMLRISIPYYNSDKELEGIVIINYLANDMLTQIEKVSTTSNGDIFMLNSDGYWIYDSKDNNEWSFMYEAKADISFKNAFPNEWRTIQTSENGYQISNQGVFIYSKILTSQIVERYSDDYSFVLGSGDWTLISYMSAESSNGHLFTQSVVLMLFELIQDNYLLYLLALIIAVIVALIMSANKDAKEQIKYFSEYDAMTGVYNRRAGFEKLRQLYKRMASVSCQITICFLDINGLKEVNDALGHEAGDELILSVVAGIQKNIRKNDFIARLGGDEFLIIFEGIDDIRSEEIWERIVQEYTNINETENRKYFISASHGTDTLRCNSNEYIDAIIKNADEKMYNEKRQIKKEFSALRHSIR